MGSLLRIEEMTGLSLLLIPLMLLVQTQGKHLLIKTGEPAHKPAKAKANTTDYRIINKGTFMNDFTQIDNRCKKNNITYFINEEKAEVKGMVRQTGGCNPGKSKTDDDEDNEYSQLDGKDKGNDDEGENNEEDDGNDEENGDKDEPEDGKKPKNRNLEADI